MKNVGFIHLLPTNKPSRLVFAIDSGNSKLVLFASEISKSTKFLTRNIFITSDEEPKEGNWCLDIYTKSTFKLGKGLAKGQTAVLNATKKIILTTDQDLIKDGVQAIDDIFLEWFVDNPSCEEVEIQKLPSINGWIYPIIIQQEETKQELLPDFKISKGIFDFVSDLSDNPVSNSSKQKLEYSEEEVLNLLNDFFDDHVNCQSANVRQWFEQNKKK
jgi:hypothetical protein